MTLPQPDPAPLTDSEIAEAKEWLVVANIFENANDQYVRNTIAGLIAIIEAQREELAKAALRSEECDDLLVDLVSWLECNPPRKHDRELQNINKQARSLAFYETAAEKASKPTQPKDQVDNTVIPDGFAKGRDPEWNGMD